MPLERPAHVAAGAVIKDTGTNRKFLGSNPHIAAVVVGSLLLLAAPVTPGRVDRYSEINLDAGVGPAGKRW